MSYIRVPIRSERSFPSGSFLGDGDYRSLARQHVAVSCLGASVGQYISGCDRLVSPTTWSVRTTACRIMASKWLKGFHMHDDGDLHRQIVHRLLRTKSWWRSSCIQPAHRDRTAWLGM
jgi:hypothetical protein